MELYHPATLTLLTCDSYFIATPYTEGDTRRIESQNGFRLRVRELRQYTHIDRYLAEASALVLAVTGQVADEPLMDQNIVAIRDVFNVMRRIALSSTDVDGCVERLRDGGLDVFLTFGGEGSIDD